MGFGSSVIARLLQTSIKKNLFYTIKDKVVEERFNGPTIHRRTQKTKVYGSDSTKAERDELIEILRDRVEYHKDKIISPTIYNELCGLEVKKNGKVEHSTNTHDDQIFSWLWALYIYYCGGDLMNNWGITKRTLRTDADLEEAVVDIHEDQSDTMQELDMSDNEEIKDQLKTLDESSGKFSYEQWIQNEIKKDNDCMDRLLQNKAVQKTLSERYNMIMPQANQSIQTIPTEVFMNFNIDDEDLQNIDSVNVGNLKNYW